MTLDTFAAVDTSVSVVGVVLTIWTLLRARGAERAAKQAREAIRQGNAAEEFRSLSVIGKDLLRCVQAGQAEAAQLRSRDLLSEMGRAKTHWKGHFDPAADLRLSKVQQQAAKVSKGLSLRRIEDMSQEEREKLLKVCHELVEKLSEEEGRMLEAAERREE